MFSSTKLKIIALIFMFIDHMGEFIPKVPVYFRWIGRMSAPLFLFCMVWGLHYTHDKKIYLVRMYICGALMSIMDLILNNIVFKPYRYVSNNIFVSLFLVGVICTILDIIKENKKRGFMLLTGFILYQIITTGICIFVSRVQIITLNYTIGAFTANLFFSEGGIVIPILGVILYYCKEHKNKVAIAYSIVCLIILGFNYSSCHNLPLFLFTKHFEWMMIGALPFMYLYNNQKGKGLKYFFYTFYPAHIFILFWIGNAYFKHWFV